MNTNTTTLRTDSKYLVTHDVQEAGCISYWRLAAGTSLARLRAAWIAQGLDEKKLPKPPAIETAAYRAVHALKDKRRLVRPLERRGAWVVVSEVVDPITNTTQYVNEMRFRVIQGNLVAERIDADQALFDALAASTDKRFRAAADELSAHDVGSWLVDLSRTLGAVSLRESGGVYFIPRANTETWRKIAAAVEAANSHSVFRIPALRNDEAIAAIADAITAEADAAVAEIEADLQTGEIGERALRTREARCRDMSAKVASYETLLNVKLDAVRARLERLTMNVTAAALV